MVSTQSLPEHLFDPDGDVVFAFHKYPETRSRRTTAKDARPSIHMRTSSAVLAPASNTFRAMIHYDKILHADDFAENGFVVIHLPEDDGQAFSLILMALHGAGTDKMAEVVMDMPTLVQLATLVDKYEVATALASWVDFWIDSAREVDTAILPQIGTYIWVAQVFRADRSFMELTAMAQSQCTGVRKFKLDWDKGCVTPLPRWVMDAILAKRLAAFGVMRRALLDTERDCKNHAKKLMEKQKPDPAGFLNLPAKLQEIWDIAAKLGIPRHSRLTQNSIRGISYNMAMLSLRELRKNTTERPQVSSKQSKCRAICNAPTPPSKGSGTSARTAAPKRKNKGGRKEMVAQEKFWDQEFDPVVRILRYLGSNKSWTNQASTLGWGFGLGYEAVATMARNTRSGSKRKRK